MRKMLFLFIPLVLGVNVFSLVYIPLAVLFEVVKNGEELKNCDHQNEEQEKRINDQHQETVAMIKFHHKERRENPDGGELIVEKHHKETISLLEKHRGETISLLGRHQNQNNSFSKQRFVGRVTISGFATVFSVLSIASIGFIITLSKRT